MSAPEVRAFVVRDGLERCAWCTHWRRAGEPCGECDCAPIAPGDYGVARMLREAGVDRLALPGRVAELEGGERNRLQQRFDQQVATLRVRIDEARFCEDFLLQRRFASQIADEWFASLPWDRRTAEQMAASPQGPFDDPVLLDAVVEDSPFPQNRLLAALALVHRHQAQPEVLERAQSAIRHQRDIGEQPDIYEVEAALALGSWRYHYGPVEQRIGVEAARLARVARRALADEELRRRAAAVCTLPLGFALKRPWMTRAHAEASEEMETLVPILREGLADANEDVRLACALALPDEAVLRTFRDHADARVRQTAREMLARIGSTEIVDLIEEAEPPDALAVVERLPVPPASRLLSAAIDLAGRALPQTQKRIGRHLRRAPITDYDAPARQALARMIGDEAAPLPVEELFDWLRWATRGESDYAPPRLDEQTRPFVDAVARALAPRSPAEQAEAVRAGGMHTLLWASASEAVQAVLDAWAVAEDESVGTGLFGNLASLDSAAERHEGATFPTARRIALGIWERAQPADRLRIATWMSSAWSWAYAQDREASFELFWERYRDFPAERAAVRAALSGLLQREGGDRLTERHRKELPEEPLCGADPAAFFDQLVRAQRGRNYDHLKLTLEDAAMADAIAVLSVVAAHRPTEETDTQQLPPFVLFARWLAERAKRNEAAGELERAVDALAATWRDVVASVAAKSEDESYYFREKKEEVAGVLEKVRARIAELRERAPEPEAEEPEPEPEPPQPPPDFEIIGESTDVAGDRAGVGPASPLDAIAGKLLASVRDAPVPEPPRPPDPAPEPAPEPPPPAPDSPPPLPGTGPVSPLGIEPIDTEVLFVDQPIRTLQQYVELVRALQAAGANPMEVLTRFGLDLQTFPAALQAWSAVLSRRTDLAMRFAALFSAS